jgi:hypothetical protein
MSFVLAIMRTSSSLLVSSGTAMGLTAIAIAIAVILLASNFTIINAQPQQVTSQPGEVENGTAAAAAATPFQSTNDSFSIQVPQGWVIQDLNNTGSASLEEARTGYALLAQLCPEEQQGAAALPNVSGSGDTVSCQGSQNDVVHIIRYPDLDTRLQAANNVTANNNMTTSDNILSYQLQKLQEVGYRSVQIVNSTDVTLNLTDSQTDETITTVPSKLVEVTYSTASAPNETRTGHLISTATNATAPNLGTTKGYSVFYEGNSTTTAPAAEITTASGSLLPPPAVGQILDSFELIVAPEEAQAAETADNGGDDDDDDDGDDNGGDDDGGDDDGGDDDGGNGGDDDGGDDDGGDDDGGNGGDDDGGNGGDDDGGNGGDDDGGNGGGGAGDDEFDDCIQVPPMDPGDVGC